jgi:hypothetical protein
MIRKAKYKSARRQLPLETIYTVDNVIYIMPSTDVDDDQMIWYKYTPSNDLRLSVSIWRNSLRHNISLKDYLMLIGLVGS